MKMMPIHCCCNPDVLLGVVPVPIGTAVGTVPLRRKDAPTDFNAPFDAVFTMMEVAPMAAVTIDRDQIGIRTKPAIKSNDMPLSELQKLEGFEEFTEGEGFDPSSVAYKARRERWLAEKSPGYEPTISGEIAALIEACGCDSCARMKA